MSQQDQRNAGLKISFAVSRAHPSPSHLQVGERCDKTSNEERNTVSVAIAGWHKPGKDFSQCSRNHGHGRQAQRCLHRRPKSSERRRRYWLAEVQHRNDRGSPAAWGGGRRATRQTAPLTELSGVSEQTGAARTQPRTPTAPAAGNGRIVATGDLPDRLHRRSGVERPGKTPGSPEPRAALHLGAGTRKIRPGRGRICPPATRRTRSARGAAPRRPAGEPLHHEDQLRGRRIRPPGHRICSSGRRQT